ncbi:hypothetical protein Tco_0565992, partial [Tanacetum coccineum]
MNLKSIELLGVLRHTETWLGLSDMDAVRVCLLLVAELVFMGKEDRNCIPKHLVSLVEDFDCWNDYPWGEYMWVKFYKRMVNVVAKHTAFHLDKKKQNPDYYPTYNLYGFPLAFKIWILETYPNSRKWWSKKDNVLPHALAWSNVTKFGKNDYNGLLGPDLNPNLQLYATPVEQQTEWFKASIEYINGLVDLDMNVSGDGISGDVSNNSWHLNDNAVSGNGNAVSGNGNNDVLLLEGVMVLWIQLVVIKIMSVNKINKIKLTSLADVLYELRALRKESSCLSPEMPNDEVVVDGTAIHNADEMYDSPNCVTDNDVNKSIGVSSNYSMLNISCPEMHNAEVLSNSSDHEMPNAVVVVACMGIDKPNGHNDNPNANDNDVNKGINLMSTCSGPDMHLAKVSVAGMEIDKGDGHIDIPTASDNDVNLAKTIYVNDPMPISVSPDMLNAEVVICSMGFQNEVASNVVYEGNVLDVLIQVACDGMGIDKADGYSQREPSTLNALIEGFDSQNNNPGIDFLQHDDHENEFVDDFMDVLNDEESIPKVTLDDMNVDEQEKKLIDTVKVIYSLLGFTRMSAKERKKRLAMALESPFGQQPPTTPVLPKRISRSVNCDFILPLDFEEPKMRYPVVWRDVEKVYFPVNEPKRHWCLAELHITTGV